jgi:hypothetical protein
MDAWYLLLQYGLRDDSFREALYIPETTLQQIMERTRDLFQPKQTKTPAGVVFTKHRRYPCYRKLSRACNVTQERKKKKKREKEKKQIRYIFLK